MVENAPPKKRKKILVVDDSPTILAITTSVLEEAGYQVIPCEISVELIRMLVEYEPDLTLLDVQMPYITGDILGKMVRPHTRSKLILFSSLDEATLQKMAEESGVDGYLQKTDNFSEVVQLVRQYIGE
jgi:DNA-binding response OmpR family regulator